MPRTVSVTVTLEEGPRGEFELGHPSEVFELAEWLQAQAKHVVAMSAEYAGDHPGCPALEDHLAGLVYHLRQAAREAEAVGGVFMDALEVGEDL